jgi:hypothetical protein
MKSTLAIFLIFLFSYCESQSINDEINSIKKEVRKINNDQTLHIDSIDLIGESTDGGVLLIFKDKNQRQKKIIAKYYCETGKNVKEFYIKNEKLLFCLAQLYIYNRPYYWDETHAKENGDSEVFDDKKTIIEMNRYYFDSKGDLVQMIDKTNKVIRDKMYLMENERDIKIDFESLKKKN